MPITYLINFNTYYTDNVNKVVFDEYYFKNQYGNILSQKFKVFCINIEECYNLWYHNNYQGMFGLYEEDKRKLTQGIINEEKRESFNDGLSQGIIQGITQGMSQGITQGTLQTKKEMVLNMYNEHLPIETISKYTKLSELEITDMIESTKQ